MGRAETDGPVKPKGRASSYAFFVKTCREEYKRRYPDSAVSFSEFNRKCGEKWKSMTSDEKQRFEDMSSEDKVRYDKEMAAYTPPPPAPGQQAKKGKRPKKDPAAPKRPLSAYFLFCGEARGQVKAEMPELSTTEISKELGKRWEACTERTRFEQLAVKDKERYARQMEEYKGTGPDEKKVKVEEGPAATETAADEEEEDDEDEEEGSDSD